MGTNTTYTFGSLLAREYVRYPAQDYGTDEHEVAELAEGTERVQACDVQATVVGTR